MKYVDGYVLPVPKKKIDAYRTLAKKASKIWMEHGALQYCECVGEDLKTGMGIPFVKMPHVKANETVIFAWITYKSRAHRDKVNAKVMADPRIEKMANKDSMPFDYTRMSFGGFNVIVDA